MGLALAQTKTTIFMDRLSFLLTENERILNKEPDISVLQEQDWVFDEEWLLVDIDIGKAIQRTMSIASLYYYHVEESSLAHVLKEALHERPRPALLRENKLISVNRRILTN